MALDISEMKMIFFPQFEKIIVKSPTWICRQDQG